VFYPGTHIRAGSRKRYKVKLIGQPPSVPVCEEIAATLLGLTATWCAVPARDLTLGKAIDLAHAEALRIQCDAPNMPVSTDLQNQR
jgi:hypothetical protein